MKNMNLRKGVISKYTMKVSCVHFSYNYIKINYLFYIKEILEKYDEIVLSDIMSKYEGKFVDSKTPSIINLDQILNKLISMNKEFVNDENFNLEWLCVIIDDDQKQELVVDDSMKFVIMTKATLQLCENEHQMAYLLANAMGHYILKHKREPVIVLYDLVSKLFNNFPLFLSAFKHKYI